MSVWSQGNDDGSQSPRGSSVNLGDAREREIDKSSQGGWGGVCRSGLWVRKADFLCDLKRDRGAREDGSVSCLVATHILKWPSVEPRVQSV